MRSLWLREGLVRRMELGLLLRWLLLRVVVVLKTKVTCWRFKLKLASYGRHEVKTYLLWSRS